MGTHRVSSSAAMRFLVLVFITLTVVAAANGSNNDHDSDSLVPQQAEETPQLDSGSIEELTLEDDDDDDDEALDSRAKAACKRLSGRCIRVKNRHNCRLDRNWCTRGGRSLCGRKRICCYPCGGK